MALRRNSGQARRKYGEPISITNLLFILLQVSVRNGFKTIMGSEEFRRAYIRKKFSRVEIKIDISYTTQVKQGVACAFVCYVRFFI